MSKTRYYIPCEPITREAVMALQSPHTPDPEALEEFTFLVRWAMHAVYDTNGTAFMQAYCFENGAWFLAPHAEKPLRLRPGQFTVAHFDPMAVGMAATQFALDLRMRVMEENMEMADGACVDERQAHQKALEGAQRVALDLAIMAKLHHASHHIAALRAQLLVWFLEDHAQAA